MPIYLPLVCGLWFVVFLLNLVNLVQWQYSIHHSRSIHDNNSIHDNDIDVEAGRQA